jgi:hypothetical protein
MLQSGPLLEAFVRSLCQKCLELIINNEDIKYIKFQLIIIIELQKLFPGDKFKGNRCLVRLFIGCLDSEIDNFNQQLEKIFHHQFQTPNFFNEIFSLHESEKNEQFLRYCLLIMIKVNEQPTLLSTALTANEETNFLCLVTSLLASDFLHVLETDDTLYEQFVDEAVKIIAASNCEKCHYETVEKFLINGMLSDGIGLGVVCFDIMCQFLSTSTGDIVSSYFVLFQDILSSVWDTINPFTERRQILMGHASTLLYQMNEKELESLIKPELKVFLCGGEAAQGQQNFTFAINSFMQQPSNESYGALVKSIGTASQDNIKSFCHLMETVRNLDWSVFTALVVAIIKHITEITELDRKMLLLLKLNPMEKDIQQVPMVIKYNLLFLIVSIPSVKNNYENLKNYVDSLLTQLLDDDCSLRRLYSNLIGEEVTFEGTTIEALLRSSNNIAHTPSEIESSSTPDATDDLYTMLELSKRIASQKLSKDELSIVKSIVTSLQDACKKEAGLRLTKSQ